MADDNDEELLIVHVPALVAVLLDREKEKGAPLTQAEVLSIRDNASCIAMPRFAQMQVEQGRGNADIDPENAWREWQVARLQFVDRG